MTIAARRTTALRELPRPSAGPLANVAERVILKGLGLMTLGGLELRLPDGSVQRFGDPHATEWHGSRSCATISSGASRCAAGSGSVRPTWPATSRRPTCRADRAPGAQHRGGARARPAEDDHEDREPAAALQLPNTRRRAERKIHYHYDLGNEFYRLFSTIADVLVRDLRAPRAEPRRRPAGQVPAHLRPARPRRRRPRARDRLRWGGFALHAARERGCRVTGVTISREQHDEAARRVAERASPTGSRSSTATSAASRGRTRTSSRSRCSRRSARRCTSLLRHARPRARARRARAACRRSRCPGSGTSVPPPRDFIQAYIFPGGHLPSLEVMARAMGRSSRLHVQGLEEIGPHYADTCGCGARRSTRASTRCARSATTSGSCASGTTTWRSVRRGSASGSCATSRWCSPGPAGSGSRADCRPCWTSRSRRSGRRSSRRCRRSGCRRSGRTCARAPASTAAGCRSGSRWTRCATSGSPTRRSCARARRRRRRSATTWRLSAPT